jgi:hypothetical protein
VEPPRERRRILDRIWESDEEQGAGFPFGTVIVVLTVVLTIMAVFLTTQGESRTGDDVRWGIFILLVIILCMVVVRWTYPVRAWYEGQDRFIDTKDMEFKQGLDRGNAVEALEGNIFNQVNLLQDLRETYANKVMVRRHLTRADLRTAIERGPSGSVAMDADLAWMLKAIARDIEDLLMDDSNGIRVNFYVWFSDMLRKVEEWH